MPAERLSMRKIKEVLRLKFELGLPNRQIARSCSINHSTVADYLNRAGAAGLNHWPLPADLDEAGLEARLFPARMTPPSQPRQAVDWAAIHEELHSQKQHQDIGNEEFGDGYPGQRDKVDKAVEQTVSVERGQHPGQQRQRYCNHCREPGEKEPHWNDSAELVITAFTAFVVACETDPSASNLCTVRRLVGSRERYNKAVERMQQLDGFGGVIRELGHELTWFQGDELASVLTHVQRHLQFLDSPDVAACISTSSGPARPASCEWVVSVWLIGTEPCFRHRACGWRTGRPARRRTRMCRPCGTRSPTRPDRQHERPVRTRACARRA